MQAYGHNIADFFPVEYNGETYYVGEEVILNSERQEIGWVCSRGVSVVVATDEDGNDIASKHYSAEESQQQLATDADVVRAVVDLHTEHIEAQSR